MCTGYYLWYHIFARHILIWKICWMLVVVHEIWGKSFFELKWFSFRYRSVKLAISIQFLVAGYLFREKLATCSTWTTISIQHIYHYGDSILHAKLRHNFISKCVLQIYDQLKLEKLHKMYATYWLNLKIKSR